MKVMQGIEMLLAIGQDVTERKQSEAALRESEQRFMDVLHTSGDAILLIDGETFVDCNEATSQMLGYSNREEFLMTHPSELSPPAQPDGRNSFEKANEMIRTAFEKGFHRFEWMHRKADGGDFPVEVSLTSIPYQGRTILHCLWRDLSDQKRVEEQLRTLHRAVEQSSSTIVITDPDGKIEYGNPQFETTTGYTLEEAYGQNPSVLKSGQQSPEFYAELWETISSGRVWRGEFLNKRKDGSLYWEAACISPVFDAQGRITQYVAVKDDVSARKRAEEQLRTASEQDPLTGVFNRRAFHARFSQEWERAARHGQPLACVMVDLDFFKRINDTHGHATGDETLKAVAHLLRDQGRPSDIPCRYGGEEFCILSPRPTKPALPAGRSVFDLQSPRPRSVSAICRYGSRRVLVWRSVWPIQPVQSSWSNWPIRRWLWPSNQAVIASFVSVRSASRCLTRATSRPPLGLSTVSRRVT
jgi:PAS domain S-box-containing protein